MKTKIINDVTELAKDLGFNQSEIKSMRNDLINHSVSRMMTLQRCKAGLTQKELADKLGVSLSDIEKIEHAYNHEINEKLLDLCMNELKQYIME